MRAAKRRKSGGMGEFLAPAEGAASEYFDRETFEKLTLHG
jgi:hypothetical protein